jgi:hypothetical protein
MPKRNQGFFLIIFAFHLLLCPTPATLHLAGNAGDEKTHSKRSEGQDAYLTK